MRTDEEHPRAGEFSKYSSPRLHSCGPSLSATGPIRMRHLTGGERNRPI